MNKEKGALTVKCVILTTKEGIAIEVNDRFVADVVNEVLHEVTKQLTGIELKPPATRKKRIENPVSVVVLSKGTFKSKMVGVFPADFLDSVICGMGGGDDLTQEDRDAYFKEYLNMFYGRFISRINNEIGKASRFVIPVLLRGTYRETTAGMYRNEVTSEFLSDQGRITFDIYYEVLPEYSSN